MPFYIKCGSAAVWKYCKVRAHSHNADAAATVDQFFQHYFFCVCACPITFLAMHNCTQGETAIILHTISAHCLCLRSINALFSLCLPEEQLEEDKLHSNGGKVLSSELKNNHSGCSPFQRCVCSLSVIPSSRFGSSLCSDSSRFASVLFWHVFLALPTPSIYVLICSTSAHLSAAAATLIRARQITAKLILHYTKFGRRRRVIHVFPADKIIFTVAIKKLN